MNDWQQLRMENTIGMLPKGWKGLWQHFLALARGDELPLVPQTVSVSIWVKAKGELVVGPGQVTRLQ